MATWPCIGLFEIGRFIENYGDRLLGLHSNDYSVTQSVIDE